MKAKINLTNIWAYISGNIRYFCYYNMYFFRQSFLPLHIKEQISWRIKVMDKECYNNGSCKLCGCKTTNLQCASKSCDGNCYPPMMGKHTWNVFKIYGIKQWENGKKLG